MPFVHIHLIQGRNADDKRRVIEKVTDALVEALNAPRESVRISILDVPSENWGIAGVPAKDLGR
jgi:4-oxalocrotonate tautomerase